MSLCGKLASNFDHILKAAHARVAKPALDRISMKFCLDVVGSGV